MITTGRGILRAPGGRQSSNCRRHVKEVCLQRFCLTTTSSLFANFAGARPFASGLRWSNAQKILFHSNNLWSKGHRGPENACASVISLPSPRKIVPPLLRPRHTVQKNTTHQHVVERLSARDAAAAHVRKRRAGAAYVKFIAEVRPLCIF